MKMKNLENGMTQNKNLKIYSSFKSVEFNKPRHYLSQSNDRETAYQIIQKNKSSSSLQSQGKIAKNNMENESIPISYLSKFQPKTSTANNSHGTTYRINIPKDSREKTAQKYHWKTNPSTEMPSPRAEFEQKSNKTFFKFKRRTESTDGYNSNFRLNSLK